MQQGSRMLNGIDKSGTFLAKLFTKICTYGLAYAVIYLAVQTVLPGLRSAFVYNVAMIIVMGSPELMIGGLAVEAMEKFKESKALGTFLFIVAILFLSIGVLTMFDIFAWHFKDGSSGQQLLSLYRAVVVLCFSAIHGIVTKMNEQREEQAKQIVNANDRLTLKNQKEIADAGEKINTVHGLLNHIQDAYTKQEGHIQNLEAYVQTLENHIQNASQTIDTTIDNRINELSTSVTEIHNNVLQITQNNHVYGPGHTSYPPLARDEQEGYSVQEIASEPTMIEQTKNVVIPALEVAGIQSEKIMEVLTFVLSGNSWTKASKDLNLNYSRIIKPIREAYERSMEESIL